MIYCPYSNYISCNRCHVSIATTSYMRRNDRSVIKDTLYPLYKWAFLTDFIFLHGYWVKMAPLCQGERGNFKQNLSHLCEFQRGLMEVGWKSGRWQSKPVEQGGEKTAMMRNLPVG